MSDIPDLDTTSVGYIAYWNALDHGIPDIDPIEVTSSGNVGSYTVYDNGVTGDYQLLTGRTASFRVKEDGWMVVYIDDTESLGQGTGNQSNRYGQFSVANDWSWVNDETVENINAPAVTISNNTLSVAIYRLSQELSNSGSLNFNHSDVGLYNYVESNADTTTLTEAAYIGDFSRSDALPSYRFSYTGTTDIKKATGTLAIYGWPNRGDAEVDVTWSDGTVIAQDIGDGDTRYAAMDLLARGMIPNANTEYGHDFNPTYSGYDATFTVTVHAMWS